MGWVLVYVAGFLFFEFVVGWFGDGLEWSVANVMLSGWVRTLMSQGWFAEVRYWSGGVQRK